MVLGEVNLVRSFSLGRRKSRVSWVCTNCFGCNSLEGPIILKTNGSAFESNKQKTTGLREPLLYSHRGRVKVAQPMNLLAELR